MGGASRRVAAVDLIVKAADVFRKGCLMYWPREWLSAATDKACRVKRSSPACLKTSLPAGEQMDSRIFPTILMVLDVFAALCYAADGDWRKTVYWLSAAVLTAVVTW